MVGRHISTELKETALSMSLQGIPDAEIRASTGISERSLKRMRSAHREAGGVIPRRPVDSSQPRVLGAMEGNFLRGCVERRVDISLAELKTELYEVCGVDASIQTVARSLQGIGYSMRTVTHATLARSQQERKEFRALVAADFRPEQLVFADQSYFHRLSLRRPYAWSMGGERGPRFEFFLRDTKYNVLPAICLDGVLHLEVVENAITGSDFRRFVEGLLPRMNKFPLPNSVLVLDNAAIHKVGGIRDLVEAHGARLLYIPSHSPDLNPIELSFAPIKEWLRTNRDRLNVKLESENCSVYDVFWEAVHSVTVEHAKDWYNHCWYPTPL